MRLAAVLVCLTALASPVHAADMLSGRYGPLLLAVRDGTVAGVYSEGRGMPGGPQFSCYFVFDGKLADGRADITVRQPEPGETLHGTFTVQGDAVALQLDENGDGCAMTSGDMVKEPYVLDRDSQRPAWQSVALVSADKAVMQKGPARDAQRRKPYLVQGDPVAVLQRQGDWLRVEYEGEGKPVTGWMQASDLLVTAPR
ncbi:DUF2141 domain-containing protein [Bordetella genomosp. 13]|uniref:DUF2141 domain-containing protein n=1 Tax=Bordetella genomosp. 13 TaxID=463040 RepID=UPI0011A02252|nr:DUF2141 domain-containing protein [Bordetella genomosp. 13]